MFGSFLALLYLWLIFVAYFCGCIFSKMLDEVERKQNTRHDQ